MTLEQELHVTARYHVRLFKEKMDRLYAIVFDKIETQEIEELLVDFYEDMKVREAQCQVPPV